jgi:hypothetical protein
MEPPPPYTEPTPLPHSFKIHVYWDEIAPNITPKAIPPRTYEALHILSNFLLQRFLDNEEARKQGRKGLGPANSVIDWGWARIFWRIIQIFDQGIHNYLVWLRADEIDTLAHADKDMWVEYCAYSRVKNTKISAFEAYDVVMSLLNDLNMGPYREHI